MGVYTYTHEATSSVAPSRLFKALVVDANNFIPNLMPQHVKNIENVEGNGGAGTIKKMNYVEGGKNKYMKHKIHAIDDKNLVSKYSLVEGEVLGDKLESVTYDVKYEASGNGGSICKASNVYHTKGNHVFNEEEHNECEKRGMEIFKAVEAYLLANPAVYA